MTSEGIIICWFILYYVMLLFLSTDKKFPAAEREAHFLLDIDFYIDDLYKFLS
jgi:hypothetical protein